MSAKVEFDSKHKKRSTNMHSPDHAIHYSLLTGPMETEQSWQIATQSICIYWWYQTPLIFSHCRCWLLIHSKCLLPNLAPMLQHHHITACSSSKPNLLKTKQSGQSTFWPPLSAKRTSWWLRLFRTLHGSALGKLWGSMQ